MDHKPMYRLMKPTLLFALTLLLCSCQPSDAPPQVVRVEAPASQLAPAPAADAQPDIIMKSYSLPEAILRLRQGVGRLIRSKTDTGTIVILDSRIVSKPYGKAFLRAMPPCPVEIH